MKKIIFNLVFIVLLACNSCTEEPQNQYLSYQNIVIISDMSDRLEQKINGGIPNQQYPPKDIKEIEKILNFFKDECVKPGIKTGDKSCIYFSTFSNESIACIDIEKFNTLEDKQQFVNSTGKYKSQGLNYEIDNFKKKVRNTYNNTHNNGLDLISILMEKIEKEPLVKRDTLIHNDLDTTFINFKNHIYIFTDGYLEYWGKKLNSQFYFGDDEIKKVRDFCRSNNVNIETALRTCNSLCLPPVQNVKNQFVALHILETHERDKDSKHNRYNNFLGKRDNEILEAVWRKWAKESGFKSFEWKKY